MSGEQTNLPRASLLALAVCVLGWLCLGYCAVLLPQGAHVGSDVGYYLPLADRVGRGEWPLLDVPVHYTPLGIVLLSAPNLFFERPPYEAYSAMQCLVLFTGAVCLFFALRRSAVSAAAAGWAAAYYFFCGMYFEGSTMLEPYVVLFASAALLLLKSPGGSLRFGCIGLFAALGVLCKQQGVFLVFGLGLLTAFEGERSGVFKRAASFVAGGSLGLLGLIALVSLSRLGWHATFSNLTWSGRHYSGNALGVGLVVVGSLFLLKTSAFMVGAPFASRPAKEWVPMVGATLIALVPSVLKPYPHYLLLAVPFSAMIAGWVIDSLLLSPRVWSRAVLAGLVGLWLVQFVRLARRLTGPEANLAQLRKEGAELKAAINGGRVLQLTSPALTYFADITPSGVETAGYMFGDLFRLAEVRDSLLPGAAFVLTEPGVEYFEFNDGRLRMSELEAAGFCRRPTRVADVDFWSRCDAAAQGN